MAPPVLALSNVRVSYGGADVLDVGALEVAEGEVLAVIGPNGCGKSTLLRVAGLLERPATGRVSFRGRVADAGHALAERRRMAMVFQQPLLADMTVAENAALGLAFRGVGADLCEARVGRWLERLNIAPLRDRRARTLSGGEAQRVALARALVVEPDLLLLDEPFAGLDEPSRGTLRPDEGHIHVSLDGQLVSMAYSTTQDLPRDKLTPGVHTVQAEFVAINHNPFKNRPLAYVQFTVRSARRRPVSAGGSSAHSRGSSAPRATASFRAASSAEAICPGTVRSTLFA